jgi:hypothetical protein
MQDEKEKQLEELIHRELRRLPEVPASATLVHRVMLAIHERAKQPWWKRSWLAWPFGIQLISLVLLLASAGLVSYLLGAAWDGVNMTSIAQRVAESFAWLKPVWQVVAALLSAVLLLARTLGHQALLIGAAVVIFAYLTFVGLGTVCVRVALNKA